MTGSRSRYSIAIKRSAEREMNRLSPPMHGRISDAILALERQPRPVGCRKLVGGDGWRLRVGDYRVLYLVDDAARTVAIVAVRHRREAYRR